MVFFGGVNSLTGSTLGAFILTALPEVLRKLASYRYIVYSILVILIINFKPNGIFGEWELTPKNVVKGVKKLVSLFQKKEKRSAE